MAWTNRREPTVMEIRTFGPNVRISPLTDRPLEDGFGAFPDDVQEWQQTFAMDKARGDEIRKKITDMKNLKTAKASVVDATAKAKADGLPVQ
jgi:hypothetical protein